MTWDAERLREAGITGCVFDARDGQAFCITHGMVHDGNGGGRDLLRDAFETFLIEVEGGLRAGTAETPERAAKALRELTVGYSIDVASLFKTFDGEGYDQMVAVAGVPFWSLCEHHLLPFIGKAHVVYVPNGKVIGASKIPRVVHAFARRLQIQERLTTEIADALEKYLKPNGIMVMAEATHLCMVMRGVRSPGVLRTSALRGVLMESPQARAEAQWLIERGGTEHDA